MGAGMGASGARLRRASVSDRWFSDTPAMDDRLRCQPLGNVVADPPLSGHVGAAQPLPGRCGHRREDPRRTRTRARSRRPAPQHQDREPAAAEGCLRHSAVGHRGAPRERAAQERPFASSYSPSVSDPEACSPARRSSLRDQVPARPTPAASIPCDEPAAARHGPSRSTQPCAASRSAPPDSAKSFGVGRGPTPGRIVVWSRNDDPAEQREAAHQHEEHARDEPARARAPSATGGEKPYCRKLKPRLRKSAGHARPTSPAQLTTDPGARPDHQPAPRNPAGTPGT